MNRRKRMQFWGENEDDDALVLEIERGEKTATACKFDDYTQSYGPYDDGNWRVGDAVEVYDLKQRLRCLIEITEVYPVTWASIPEKLWQGEACCSAQHFREAHLHCWPEYQIDDNFKMMATHFKLVQVFTQPD